MNARTKSIQIPTLWRIEAIKIFVIRAATILIHKPFDRFLEEGAITTRGLKPDADVFAEMVFDVNTSYFEQHSGYEYAKDFFEKEIRWSKRCEVTRAGGTDLTVLRLFSW